MFKLILIAAILLAALKIQSFTSSTAPTSNEAIALVKYKDMVYSCQGVVETWCGHSIHCGDVSVHCVTNIQVEYLQ